MKFGDSGARRSAERLPFGSLKQELAQGTMSEELIQPSRMVRPERGAKSPSESERGCPPPLVAESTGDQLRRGLAIARKNRSRAEAEGPASAEKSGSEARELGDSGARDDGISLRAATPADAAAIHRLVTENLEAGHLLPRSIVDIEEHASRFVVAEAGTAVVGCAELAPLSDAVAEVRSLVVAESFRGRHIGRDLVAHVAAAGAAQGFATLCAFTHEPAHFVRLGFTLVPHIWVPEKIAHDCTACSLFRRCGQYAVTLPLRAGSSVRPERPAAVIHGRGVAARRSSIERLQLRTVPCDDTQQHTPADAVPA